jgi:hypothetical protein
MKGTTPLDDRSQYLADMLDVESDRKCPWRPEELAAILRHQLSVPLEGGCPDFCAEEDRPVPIVAADTSLGSLGDLFRSPSPPIELIERVKRFAKACRTRPDSPLPDEIATVLYLLAIVVARTKCGRSISQLDDAALQTSLAWALHQPWLDKATRQLLGTYPKQ